MTNVSAVILRSEQNELLICQRGAGGSCAYLWEFPGGKQEPGETPAACAVRECREELQVEIGSLTPFGTSFYRYPDRDIFFTFFEGKILSGKPERSVHTEIRWVSPAALSDCAFCPADEEILQKWIARG